MLKHSKQRDAILASLQNRYDHPTADTLYNELREEYPNISLGTVYRNLSILSEHGIIQKVNCGDGFDHFDGNPKPHYHFICNACGKVQDLVMDKLDFINTLAANGFDGEIQGNCTYFYGKCNSCVDIPN